MAKEKLFTPEDFDKVPRSPKKNVSKWVIGAIILIGVIVAIIFGIKGCNSNNESNSTEDHSATSEFVKVADVDTTNIEEIAAGNKDVKQQSETQDLQEPEINTQQEPNAAPESVVMQPKSDVNTDVESEAFKVIRGDYGNYPERKNVLGDKYESIQNRVNQLKRQGVF